LFLLEVLLPKSTLFFLQS